MDNSDRHRKIPVNDENTVNAKAAAAETAAGYLEEERKKSDFLLSQTKEIWFRYSFSPSALTLSKASAGKLKVPCVIENPFDDERIKAFFADGQYEHIKAALENNSGSSSFYEEELQINTADGSKRYRLSMYIVRSEKSNTPELAFGIFQDIDGEHEKLHMEKEGEIQDITSARVRLSMKYFKRMLMMIRLVEPEVCMQFTIDPMGRILETLLDDIASYDKQLYIDSMTGAYNRRYYDERLSGLEGEFAFAIIDMDNFKKINDSFGHCTGDAVLKSAAQAIRENIRVGDELVRLGGDEFFLLLHDIPRYCFKKRLEAVLDAVRNIRFTEYPELRATVSIGGAYERGKLSELLKKADNALYKAKVTKNRIYIYEN